MNRYSEIWRIMAILDTAYPILISFRQVRQKRLRMCHVASQWYILQSNSIYWSRMTLCRQWCPTMVKNITFARVSPFQGRIEGPRCSISGYSMYGTLRQDGRIWSSVAYNGPVFAIVSRYDRLETYLSLHYLFRAVGHFPSGLIILRSKCLVSAKVARNGP